MGRLGPEVQELENPVQKERKDGVEEGNMGR